MSGKRLNRGERQFVTASRKAVKAEQRVREELFLTVIRTDAEFGKLFAKSLA